MSDGADERLWPGLSDAPSGAGHEADGPGADDDLDARVEDLFSSAIDRQVAEQREMNRLLADLDRSFATIRSRLDELQGQVARDVAPAADRLRSLERAIRSVQEDSEKRIDALGERVERQIRALADAPPSDDVGSALGRVHERLEALERRLDEVAGGQREAVQGAVDELREAVRARDEDQRRGAEELGEWLRGEVGEVLRGLEAQQERRSDELRQAVAQAVAEALERQDLGRPTDELVEMLRTSLAEQRSEVAQVLGAQRDEVAEALAAHAARLRDVLTEESELVRGRLTDVVSAAVGEAVAARAEADRAALGPLVSAAVQEAVADGMSDRLEDQRGAIEELRAGVEQTLAGIDLPGGAETIELIAELAALSRAQQAAADSRFDDLQAGFAAHRSAVAAHLEEHRDAVWQHIQVESAAVDAVARELREVARLRDDVRRLADVVADTDADDERLRTLLSEGLEPVAAQLARLTTRPALTEEGVRRALGEVLAPVSERLAMLGDRESLTADGVAVVVAEALSPVTERLAELGVRPALSTEDVRTEVVGALGPLTDRLVELSERDVLSADEIRAVVTETVAPVVPEVTAIVARTASGLGAEVTAELRPIVGEVLEEALQRIRATLDSLGEASTAALDRHAAAVDRAARHADQVEAGVQRVHADLEELGAASDLLGRRIEELGSAVVAHGAAVVEIRDAIGEVREAVEIDSARTDRSTRSAQEVTQRLLTRVDDLERGLVTYVEAWGDRLIQERRELLGNLVGQLADGLTRRERKRLLGTLEVPSTASSPPRLQRPAAGPDEMPPPRRVAPPRVAQPATWPTIPAREGDGFSQAEEEIVDVAEAEEDHDAPAHPDVATTTEAGTPTDAADDTAAEVEPEAASDTRPDAEAGEEPASSTRGESGASATRRMRDALAGVPGVGPAKQSALIDAFGTLERLLAASDDELAHVPGIGPGLAERIRDTLG